MFVQTKCFDKSGTYNPHLTLRSTLFLYVFPLLISLCHVIKKKNSLLALAKRSIGLSFVQMMKINQGSEICDFLIHVAALFCLISDFTIFQVFLFAFAIFYQILKLKIATKQFVGYTLTETGKSFLSEFLIQLSYGYPEGYGLFIPYFIGQRDAFSFATAVLLLLPLRLGCHFTRVQPQHFYWLVNVSFCTLCAILHEEILMPLVYVHVMVMVPQLMQILCPTPAIVEESDDGTIVLTRARNLDQPIAWRELASITKDLVLLSSKAPLVFWKALALYEFYECVRANYEDNNQKFALSLMLLKTLVLTLSLPMTFPYVYYFFILRNTRAPILYLILENALRLHAPKNICVRIYSSVRLMRVAFGVFEIALLVAFCELTVSTTMALLSFLCVKLILDFLSSTSARGPVSSAYQVTMATLLHSFGELWHFGNY